MRLTTLSQAILFAICSIVFGAATANAGLVIKIDKTTQRMTVAVDGFHRYTWKVSTGGAGYATPSGKFRPFRLERSHFSEEWDNAPMPHSIFFTERGHAIHGSYTRNLGRAVSHGCVRLSPGNAAKLYRLVERKGLGNTQVIVTGGGFEVSGGAAPSAPVKKTRTKRKFGDWLHEGRRR